MRTKAFWLERTARVKVWIRRYRDICPKGDGKQTCEASRTIHESAPASSWGRWQGWPTARSKRKVWHTFSSKIPKHDRRWSRMRCERCGGEFDRTCTKQVWAERLHRGAPDGKLYTLRDAPIGAMWDADWLHDLSGAYTGPDGIALTVRTPGGEWHVDSQASNCTRPQDVDVPGKPGWKRFVRIGTTVNPSLAPSTSGVHYSAVLREGFGYRI